MAPRQRQSDLQVVWFKRDLRVEDHRALAGAAARGPVLPLYIAEPDYWWQPDASGRQWSVAAESLSELRAALAGLGQPLVVRAGDALQVLAEIDAALGLAALWSHQETGNTWTYARDRKVEAWCRRRGIPWHQPRQGGVVRRLASRDGWARNWDRFMAEPLTPAPAALAPLNGLAPGALPEAADLGLAQDPCTARQHGGRVAGLERLASFLEHRGQPYRRAMSSPTTAFEACSRLSPHLAWGTLSLREVAQETRARQRALRTAPEGRQDWRGALSAFPGRLHWHCHFMQKLEDQPGLESEPLHPATAGLRPGEPDRARLEAWSRGETGLPFVDACMRALRATGWLNFRMRAMLMAVASYHLWLDWRAPGLHLARVFTDYEPGIHWPQVQMQSGTTGINSVRIYNPVKQGLDQHPEGRFTRRWLPELRELPDAHLHHPWTWEERARLLDKAYPAPIADHLAAAKAARQKVWALRGSQAFRDEAARIQARHGSRRGGIPRTSRRRKAAADKRQLALEV